jgi:predicted RNase H-like HicB family nuclease
MKKDVNAVVWQEDKWFIAQCLEVDIASQGKTEAKALEAVWKLLKLAIFATLLLFSKNILIAQVL